MNWGMGFFDHQSYLDRSGWVGGFLRGKKGDTWMGCPGLVLRINGLPCRELIYPIPSMYGVYGVFTYIYHKNQPNVGKYIIHGSYGYPTLGRGKSSTQNWRISEDMWSFRKEGNSPWLLSWATDTSDVFVYVKINQRLHKDPETITNPAKGHPTWRIIPVSKWLVTPIYKPFRGITLLRGLMITMVINHLLNGMILQVVVFLPFVYFLFQASFGTNFWWDWFLITEQLEQIVFYLPNLI